MTSPLVGTIVLNGLSIAREDTTGRHHEEAPGSGDDGHTHAPGEEH